MSAPERIWADARTCADYMDGSSPITTNTYEFRNSTEYIRADLVAELEAENERLKQEAAEWEVIARAKSEEALTHRREAEAMMSALAITGAVKVNALEWDKGVFDCARPLPGMRYVACSTTPAGSWSWWLGDAPETIAVFPSEAEAKAAAQADFERRILSALEPHPRDTNPVDAHETANVRDKPEGQPISLTYRNWRGEISERTITPKRIWFGSTEWHTEPQWLITAFDLDKQADRDFALKDFIPTPEGQQEPLVTEAMVVAATEEYYAASFKNTPSDAMRMALKAAMKASTRI